jgi:hypothetical protein
MMSLKFAAAMAAALGLPAYLVAAYPQDEPQSTGTATVNSRGTASRSVTITGGNADTFIASPDEGLTTTRAYSISSDDSSDKADFSAVSFPTATAFSGRNVIWSSSGHSAEENALSRKSEDLAKKLVASKSEGEKSKLEGELTEVVEKQFDLRQKRYTDEIETLEAKIKKLKSLVEKRQEN